MNIITQGIGPGATIPYFLTLGLDLSAAAPPATARRTYTPPLEDGSYAVGNSGRLSTVADWGRIYTPPERGS